MSLNPRTYEHLAVSRLRAFTSGRLRQLDHVVIVHDGAEPIRALVPYELFMQLQEQPVAASPPRTERPDPK